MAPPREDHVAFRGYLSNVFEYAGTLSLAKELDPVKDATRVEPCDVFIHGGSPGHPVLVGWVADGPGGLVRGLALSAGVLAFGALLASRHRALPNAPAHLTKPLLLTRGRAPPAATATARARLVSSPRVRI